MANTTNAATGCPARRKGYFSRHKVLYFMLAPALAYLLIFHYIPMFGAVIAFKNFNIVKGVFGSDWIGLKNFSDMFTSKDFYNVLKNSVFISVCRLFWSFPAPIILALLLNEVRGKIFKRVTQTVFYLPYFISWVVMAGIIMNFLSPTDGLINYIAVKFGGQPQAFLQQPKYFVPILVITEIWKNAGWGSIIYLAAITSINQEMYEAAYIDGANRLQRMWYITFPSILPTVVVMFILNAGNIVKNGFEQIFLLYNPTVYDVGDVIETYTYRLGIQGGQFSYSTAVGLFQAVVGFFLITLTNGLAKRFRQGGIY
jgi:putative aldouronate transport system permease protein